MTEAERVELVGRLREVSDANTTALRADQHETILEAADALAVPTLTREEAERRLKNEIRAAAAYAWQCAYEQNINFSEAHDAWLEAILAALFPHDGSR